MHISWGGKEQGARAVSAVRLLPQPISHPQPPSQSCPHVPPGSIPLREAHGSIPPSCSPKTIASLPGGRTQQEGQEVTRRAQETQKDLWEIWHPLPSPPSMFGASQSQFWGPWGTEGCSGAGRAPCQP